MPKQWNGLLGTRFIGERDYRPDSSYVTTEFVQIFVPLIPFRSFRVKLIRQTASLTEWQLIEKVPLSGRQVASYYAFFLITAASVFGAMEYGERLVDAVGLPRNMVGWTYILSFALPFVIPWGLRRRARRAA